MGRVGWLGGGGVWVRVWVGGGWGCAWCGWAWQPTVWRLRRFAPLECSARPELCPVLGHTQGAAQRLQAPLTQLLADGAPPQQLWVAQLLILLLQVRVSIN